MTTTKKSRGKEFDLEKIGLHWFRRDLRVAGNPALQKNWKQTGGRTLGVFFFDSKFLSRADFSHNRFAFFLETLHELREELRSLGGDLLVLDEAPLKGMSNLLQAFSSKDLIVSWNRDYEPFARKRDADMELNLNELQIPFFHERDHLLFEPHEITKDDGSTYSVYSPFARKWFQALGKNLDRVQQAASGLAYLEKRAQGQAQDSMFKLSWSGITKSHPSLSQFVARDSLQVFREKNRTRVKIQIPKAGSLVAYQQALRFKDKLQAYGERRDFPAEPATSHMSLFLKNGSITVAQLIQILGLEKLDWKSTTGATRYLKELVWREFYYSILFHHPEVETQSFQKKYTDIPWENSEELFQRWKEGRTGFPIVDAGMRQLQQTGWMHNRVRMIVASFLTKDLLVNWQWGEAHFMHLLLDGDLALNNGGWQWAASTGCDPQPYFRIFNPWLQSQKFDPEGEYIAKFVPELAKLRGTAEIHEPTHPETIGYCLPIVEHAVQKEKALKLFRASTEVSNKSTP